MPKLRLIPLVFAFAFASLAGACAGEDQVSCEVVWTMADSEVGRAEIVYDTDSVDQAIEDCFIDQADHPDRPMNAAAYECSCKTL